MIEVSQTVDFLRLLSDPTRVRLVELLADSELSVAEITQITQLPQSRVSTHLGRLREAGLLKIRHQGASTFYAREESLSAVPGKLLDLLAESRGDTLLVADQARKKDVLSARNKGTNWPESVAGQMERHYSPGRTWEATALGFLKLLRLGDVLDAGSGDGSVAGLLVSRCRSITCLEKSPKVLQAARKRLGTPTNATFVPGDIHALPFPEHRFDQVLLLHVLTYAEDPAKAIREAGRVLRPGGDLLILTLQHHDHAGVTGGYGHVNQGFLPATLHEYLRKAHLRVEQCEVGTPEKRPPHFAVLAALAHKPSAPLQPKKEIP